MNTKTGAIAIVILVAIVVVAAAILLSQSSVAPTPSQSTTQSVSQSTAIPKLLTGSMFTSDAGRSHGGFEYTAEWNATLRLFGSSGVMVMALKTGLGDALKTDLFQVTQFSKNSTTITMMIDGQPTVLKLVSHDAVWNGTYDGYYIASWGSDAPPNELIGRISPTTFTGLTDF